MLECAAANVMSNVVSLWYLVAFAAAASYVARTSHRSPDAGRAVEAAPATIPGHGPAPEAAAANGG